MIKPNWDVFKAKFSGNPQSHFEWFCYLLFCKETNKPCGVFRYKNQSAIETNPVKIDGHYLGFQSKFYDTTLSSNKTELIGTLEKARRDYPELTKLYLYTNQEWTQSYPKNNNPSQKAEKTAAQKEIEEKACELDIELEWRTPSYFESSFVTKDCAYFSKFFFINGDSLQDLIIKQERHTQSILKNIKQSISFNGSDISIERTSLVDSLNSSPNKVSILCGKGGVGKTVEVKKFYQEAIDSQPIFAFKATEFELNRLNDLILGWSIDDFLSCFQDCKDKTLIIDSAEKLMDLNNQEPFKEFIDLSVEFEWRIIFTTREHYFDDLNFICLDVLSVTPNKIFIPELTEEELDELSRRYGFKVPSDRRLKGLLKLPFYLNEFLKFHDGTTKQPFDLSKFKEYLWNKKIKNGDIKREQVFSELAIQRANGGKFYLSVNEANIGTAEALSKDEVLGVYGYSFFISHDIYEEWALEKFIDIAFKNKSSTKEFFTSIGQSLPIRRSFRLWLSEQLFANEGKIKSFIESAIDDGAIESIWKDELIVAILLSDYSYSFFERFESKLLQDNLELLQRVCFILRIACKEFDNIRLPLSGIKQSDISYFTKPKGAGWSSFIDFIYDKKEQVGFANLKIFIPVLNEWNSSVKQGDTTRKASLLCLEYYKWLESVDAYVGGEKFTESMIETIAYGATEIKTELSLLIDEMYKPKENSRKTSYDHLAKLILKELGGLTIAIALPEKTLELANRCWLQEHKLDYHDRSHREAEQIFGVTDEYDFNYITESAYQTPVFYLLKFSLKATVDFVLNFINRVTLNVVEHYGKGEFHTNELTIGGTTSKVYLDNHLWSAYRGASNIPSLVQSILMALEKFFKAEYFKDDNLEAWLKYMLQRTNSSAICGVVASIAIANKDKLFNITKILLEVKEFIQFDTTRLQHEIMYPEERVKACDVEHRTDSLENLCLYYQLFARKGVVEKAEAQRRQAEIWEMLDRFYDELKDGDDSESSKLWRMCLARMDRRKMNITTEKIDDKIAISFHPEIDSDLKEISENIQKNLKQDCKFFPLSNWANNKFKQHEDYKKYKQYESEPKQAVVDLKELVEVIFDEYNPPSGDFILLNRSTHIYTSAVLIKFHRENIEEEDFALCIELIMGNLRKILSQAYRFQIGDGMDACFDIIAELFKSQPELRPTLKLILIAGLVRTDLSAFAKKTITGLWSEFDEDVESIFTGYLLLNPLYIKLIGKVRQENYEEQKLDISLDGLWQRFCEENSKIFKELETNEIRTQHTIDYSNLDLNTKSVALFLLPNSQNKWSIAAFKELVNVTVETILSEDRDHSSDFHSKEEFLRKYASYVLQSPIEDIPELLTPFVDKFNSSEGASDLLKEIVYVQDNLASYDIFWKIWEIFKPKVVQLSQEGYCNYRFDNIINAYLFALHRNREAKNWHTLKNKNIRFFNEMADKLSLSPSTLYSFAKLLNGIGSGYMSQGVYWIATILKANSELSKKDLDDNTVYYLNAYIRKYLYRERAEVRRSPELMSEMLVVLDFLIEQGEVSGYLMRESIV